MNYLKYVELAAENLQFYLWYRDYIRRWGDLPDREKALSPEWKPKTATGVSPSANGLNLSPEAVTFFKDTGFANDSRTNVSEKANPFATPEDTKHETEYYDEFTPGDNKGGLPNHTKRALNAFQSVGLKWKPCK